MKSATTSIALNSNHCAYGVALGCSHWGKLKALSKPTEIKHDPTKENNKPGGSAAPGVAGGKLVTFESTNNETIAQRVGNRTSHLAG